MKTEFAPLDVLPDSGTLVLLGTADGKLGKVAGGIDQRTDGAIRRAIELAGDKFKRGSIDLVCPGGVEWDRVIIFAIDDPADCRPLDVELLGGRMTIKLNALGVKVAHVAIDAPDDLGLDDLDVALALASGIRLRNYRFDKYRTLSEEEGDSEPMGVQGLTFHLASSGEATERWTDLSAIAAGVEHGP